MGVGHVIMLVMGIVRGMGDNGSAKIQTHNSTGNRMVKPRHNNEKQLGHEIMMR
jgi:hypothetical protein